MILPMGKRAAMMAVLLSFAAPASADVIEIGEDGARWVAGGVPLATPSVTMLAAPAGETGIGIPSHATSDQSLHALMVPEIYAVKVAELSQRFDLSPSLIEALVWQESRWRAAAISPVGAQGLAQLMPGTARDLGVDPRDPFQNLEGGARYLREQLDRFDGDIERALAAYNAGPGRVIRAGGVPRIRETQHYVAAIMGRLSNHSRQDN